MKKAQKKAGKKKAGKKKAPKKKAAKKRVGKKKAAKKKAGKKKAGKKKAGKKKAGKKKTAAKKRVGKKKTAANETSRTSRRKVDREFLEALYKGDIRTAQQAIDAGANVNCATDSRTALIRAVEQNDHEVVDFLLQQKEINLNWPDRWGATPLCGAILGAARSGDFRWVDYLLEHGADTSVLDENGRSALSRAVGYFPERIELLERVISSATVNPYNLRFNKDHPLRIAIDQDAVRAVVILLEAGAAVDEHLLHLAAEASAKQLIARLVANGADPNERDTRGNTPLGRLASKTDAGVEVARTLIAAGAEVEARNDSGETALWSACSLGNVDLVRCLLDAGANAGSLGFLDQPVLFATAVSCSEEIAELLVVSGADLHARDTNGSSIVDHCRQQLQNAKDSMRGQSPRMRSTLREVIDDSERFLTWLAARSVS